MEEKIKYLEGLLDELAEEDEKREKELVELVSLQRLL
jgi:hypothetical protein